MESYNLHEEQRFETAKHVEHILGKRDGGDYTVACWEPGQCSPYHCHPNATEIYLCIEGGGIMRTPAQTVDVVPGSFVVHPRGELHEYENGPHRTLLFRVRYGDNMETRYIGWRGHPERALNEGDIAYFAEHPAGIVFNPDGPSTEVEA